MNGALLYLKNLFIQTLKALLTSYQHNWKVLLFAILLAVALTTYVNSEKLSQILFKKKKISIFASVLFGAFTPLCACGTTAVLIGMLTTTLPWSPIMAFLTSSPLMSPDGFVLITGVIGLKFAIALTVASIIIGIGAGFITGIIEKKTDFFKNQSRFNGKGKEAMCGCKKPAPVSDCGCNISSATECACSEVLEKENCPCGSKDSGSNKRANLLESSEQQLAKNQTLISKFIIKLKLKKFIKEFYSLGLKQILLFYSVFVCIGFMVNYLVPASIISVLFEANSFYAVPLAALIGLPLYITTDSGIPIIQSIMQSGAGEGAMLAFMITGSATSAWVIAGLTTFMRKRAITLYVAFVLFGGIISGYLLDIIGIFVK